MSHQFIPFPGLHLIFNPLLKRLYSSVETGFGLVIFFFLICLWKHYNKSGLVGHEAQGDPQQTQKFAFTLKIFGTFPCVFTASIPVFQSSPHQFPSAVLVLSSFFTHLGFTVGVAHCWNEDKKENCSSFLLSGSNSWLCRWFTLSIQCIPGNV